MFRAFTVVSALLATVSLSHGGDDKALRANVIEIAALIKQANTPAPVKKPIVEIEEAIVYQRCISRGFLCRQRVVYVPMVIQRQIIRDTTTEPKQPVPDIQALARKTAVKIEEISDLMHLFRSRNKGGLGVGPIAVGNPARDSIDLMLLDLGRAAPKQKSAGLEEAGYYIAALAEVAGAKAWPRDVGNKTKKKWQANAGDLRDAGVMFAKAAASNDPQRIKAAAAKVNAICISCHAVYKD